MNLVIDSNIHKSYNEKQGKLKKFLLTRITLIELNLTAVNASSPPQLLGFTNSFKTFVAFPDKEARTWQSEGSLPQGMQAKIKTKKNMPHLTPLVH